MAPSLSTISLLAACIIPSALAFPKLNEEAAGHLALLERAAPVSERRVAFDPQAQYVSVSGKHRWQAPDFAAGDQRGPCPYAGSNRL